jgi:hypothetical protein
MGLTPLAVALSLFASSPETTEAYAEVLLRTLAADRELPKRAPDAIAVVVLFRLGDGASEAEKREVVDGLRAAAPRALPEQKVLVSELDYRGPVPLLAALRARHATALFLTSGFDETELKRVTAITRAAGVSSLGVGSAWVRAGVALGVEPQARGARLLVNLAASQREGMALDPKALDAERL